MSTFSDRVFTVLANLNGRLSAFALLVESTPPDPPRLPRKALDELLDAAARARRAADAIARSFSLIDLTALDIVDMQVRLQGETASLAAALRELGRAVERQHFVREAFGDSLVELDEAAQLVAAGVFPGAVQGLREVNVKLWDFEKIQWKRYTDILTDVVRRGVLTNDQQVRIQSIADDVAAAFADVNMLLNDLAETRAADAGALRKRLQLAPQKLTSSLKTADDQLAKASKALSPFGPVIKASKKVADQVAELLRELTIPVFPTHDRLGDCARFVSMSLYEGL